MYRSDKQFMKNPATASSRIYIGNIAENVLAPNLEEKFKMHGNILGLVLQRGFGFIQYENEAQAQTAIRAEQGSLFHGKKLNVQQAVDKARLKNPLNISPTVPVQQNPLILQPSLQGPLSSGQQSLLQKQIVPQKQELPPPIKIDLSGPLDGNINKPPENEHQMGLQLGPGDILSDGGPDRRRRTRKVVITPRINNNNTNNRERDRDWHREPDRYTAEDFNVRDMPPRDIPPPSRDMTPRDLPTRELPPRDISARDMPPARDIPQYFGREEQYRPGFAPPPILDRPERNDCEIIVVSKLLTEYAEYIEQRLKSVGLVVDLLYPNEDVPIGRVLANISSRGCLYAILVMPQNEEFRSLTLNILHGIPQEHRNIPLEDAFILIARNFDAYMRGEKLVFTAPGSDSASLNDRHPEQIQMLFNLLAENRQLTRVQYDRIIKYLQERREFQCQFEIEEGGADPNPEPESKSKQAELQSRIMNILNKSADDLPKPVEPPTSQAGATPLLKDPSVQKALDSLLSGDMFKSIAANF